MENLNRLFEEVLQEATKGLSLEEIFHLKDKKIFGVALKKRDGIELTSYQKETLQRAEEIRYNLNFNYRKNFVVVMKQGADYQIVGSFRPSEREKIETKNIAS